METTVSVGTVEVISRYTARRLVSYNNWLMIYRGYEVYSRDMEWVVYYAGNGIYKRRKIKPWW